MKIKLTKISLALLFTICSLSGCKKKLNDDAFIPYLDTLEKCKIQIVGRYKNFEALEAEFDRFNEYYPNVELSYTYLDNYKGTIATALAGEDAPDIFMTFPWMLDKTSYDPLLENAENLADSKATGIELSAVNKKLLFYMDDGSLPMVPVLTAAHGMLVNEDLFKKEGIKIPQTWTQLLDACQKFKEAGYNSPLLSYFEKSVMDSLFFVNFTKEVMKNPDAISKLNKLEPEAGEYMRSTLELVEEFKKSGFMD